MAIARGNHRGIGDEELVCSVTVEAYLAGDVPFLMNPLAR